MRRNAGRKGRRLGAYGRKRGASGYVCGFDDSKARRKKSLKALRTGGKGQIPITGDDVHLIRTIVRALDEEPGSISVYGSENPNVKDLLGRLEKLVCKDCGGRGWWLANMGEGADPCPTCNGTGVRPERRKAGRGR